MPTNAIVLGSAPQFVASGYDVQLAVTGTDDECRQTLGRLPNCLADSLQTQAIASLQFRFLDLLRELEQGAVEGLHGSTRRLGPATRYFGWVDGVECELTAPAWLAHIEPLIRGWRLDTLRLATERVGAAFDFTAFQTSTAPAALALALARRLTTRLVEAEQPFSEVAALQNDLLVLGHPLMPWDERSDDGVLESHWCYSHHSAATVRLRVDIVIDDPERSMSVTIEDMRPPGFTTE